MKVLTTSPEGAQVELTKLELQILGSIGAEGFGGALDMDEGVWRTVGMPSTKEEAEDLMNHFLKVFAEINKE